jgi:F0F1-type ATP synthase assembly protein I
MPAEQPKRRPPTIMKTFALAMELPFILVAGVLIGGGVGYWLDARFGSSPALTLLLGLFGFAGSVREVLRRIPRDDSEGSSGTKPPDQDKNGDDEGHDAGE